MYVDLRAESEPALAAALFHEDDVGRSNSLDEQLRGPSHVGNQRVCLDEKLMHVVRVIRQPRILAQENVATRDGISADIPFSRIGLSVNGFVEGEFVASVWR